jgi:hypothetical protein
MSIPAADPKFGTGAIVGTALAGLLVLGILAVLVKLYHDTKRKANKLKVYNAELQDATNPEGALRRINTLMSGHSTPEDDDTEPMGASLHSGHGQSTYNGGGTSTYVGDTMLIGSGVPPSRVGYSSPVYATQPQDLGDHGFDSQGTHDYEAEELAKYTALQHYNNTSGHAPGRRDLDGAPTQHRSPHHSPVYDHHTRFPVRSLVYDHHTRSPHHSPVYGQTSPVYHQRSPIYDDAESDYQSQRAIRNWDEEEDTAVGGLAETRTANESYREGRDS